MQRDGPCPNPDCPLRFQTAHGAARHCRREHADHGRWTGGRQLVGDGGTQRIRRDDVSRLETDEGYPIYLHNVGGKEPDGAPTRLGKWTFATKMVRDVVLDALPRGRILNVCAGETKLHKRGCEFVRNDLDESKDADLHVDVRGIDEHFAARSFDGAILDPPFDPGRAAKLYEGWHGSEYSSARNAVGRLVRPGGVVVELGWNSWSLSDKDGWEAVEHHLYRQASFKGDVHLTVDRKINQQTLVTDGGVDTVLVAEPPRRMFGNLLIDGPDGQCAFIHAGIEARCPNDAVAHTFVDHGDSQSRVEMCAEHAREDVPEGPTTEQRSLVTDGGGDQIYCGRCTYGGPFENDRGLRTHTARVHGDVEPIRQCCDAGVEMLPSDRPYCTGCGRVLGDDTRVSGGEAA